jgi:hypothetical protein
MAAMAGVCSVALGQPTSQVIKEELVSSKIKAVNYKVLGGSTTIDFIGTELLSHELTPKSVVCRSPLNSALNI